MTRTYVQTHPWITFDLDFSRFDYRLWLALGEAGSKCEHIAGVPLAPTVAQHIQRLYLAKGASATTAIEGNTLSEEEAEQIISGQKILPASQKYLADEIKNIVSAFNEVTNHIDKNGTGNITIEFLKKLNFLVLHGLSLDTEVFPGEIRQHRVFVGRYRCAPVEDCEYLLKRLCDVLNEFPTPDENPHAFNIVKAIFAHLYFVWIHPFGDGNGRTARLLELYILLSAGFPQPSGHLMSNHYNKTRHKYYEALGRAIESPEEVIAFIRYAIAGFVDGLREQLQFIKEQQWHVAWTNYVHEQFHDRNSTADIRRRHIVLALSQDGKMVQTSKISTLTPELAREYSGKTPKTVNRDINTLIKEGMIEKKKGLVRAKREMILAFLPWRNTAPPGENPSPTGR